jgi:four helix bundle protein
MNQRLDCYKLLVDVAKAMPDLITRIPRGEGYLIDQLKRALASSILNLAEGNGRYSVKERNRFFDFSLGSIKEVMAVFDIIVAYRYTQHEYMNPLFNNLTKSFNMIRKLKK